MDKLGIYVKKGTSIGKIVSPLTGEVLEEIEAPKDGLLFTMRAHPVVYKGAIMARICTDTSKEGGVDND
jgi:predicted deacylase